MPFRIALSGLEAAQTDLQVTGHNIANAGTTGFKGSRAEFADIYATSIQDVSSTAAGRGVKVSRVGQQFGQGTIDFTGNNLDLGISGEGFFVMHDSSNNVTYSRAGAMSIDRDGYVANQANERLQVFAPIGNSSTDFNTGTTVGLQLPTLSGTPSATGVIGVGINLSSAEAIKAPASFDPTDATSYNHSTSTIVYDSLGASHTSTMYYVKAASNSWRAYSYIDGSVVTPTTNDGGTPPGAIINFGTDGSLTKGSGGVSATGVVAYNNFNVAGASPLSLAYDYSSSTQYGSSFGVNNLTQDGYTTGRLTGIDFDDTGVVFARFTNGKSTALGKIALARFNNPQGLRQLGDTSWAETFGSGNAQVGEPGTSSFGLIQSGALENANVDIAEQLVRLITAQRNYQANAQVITAADTVTQTIINLR